MIFKGQKNILNVVYSEEEVFCHHSGTKVSISGENGTLTSIYLQKRAETNKKAM